MLIHECFSQLKKKVSKQLNTQITTAKRSMIIHECFSQSKNKVSKQIDTQITTTTRVHEIATVHVCKIYLYSWNPKNLRATCTINRGAQGFKEKCNAVCRNFTSTQKKAYGCRSSDLCAISELEFSVKLCDCMKLELQETLSNLPRLYVHS